MEQQSRLKTEIIEYCPLAGILAQRLRVESEMLTRRWLERINARVEVEPGRIFPSEELLNHVPLLILGVADYLEDPERVVTGEFPVVAKAMELGELRHSQGFEGGNAWAQFPEDGTVFASTLPGRRAKDAEAVRSVENSGARAD